ncbi:hypothetical protein [Moorena bouillonii]|uniref:hypothetical protein n=1 Tax=Moorena bouillonii TaxID=207920 RepID=UPI0013013805|nr:hypothetical protein [Moorena bouillonii]
MQALKKNYCTNLPITMGRSVAQKNYCTDALNCSPQHKKAIANRLRSLQYN